MKTLTVIFLAGAIIVGGTTVFLSSQKSAGHGELNIYNWSDYIAEETISAFEAETGITVTYDVYDSNEVLEAKMNAGSSGYDIVVPTSDFLARGREAGAYQDIRPDLLKNLGNMDASLQAQANSIMGTDKAGLIYMWGTTGIAYNEKMIAERLGDDAPTDSYALIFDPANAEKLADCGVVVLDAPTEVLPVMLSFMGREPTSEVASDLEAATAELTKMRPYLRYVHSSQSITDIANGDICAALMWSGDALQAADRADEAENGHVINYVVPKEGSNLWFDMMALPADSQNVENAHIFMDYMMRPEVAAANTNYIWYANANAAATPLVDSEILEHPGIYPSEEARQNMYVLPAYSAETDRLVNRLWASFLTGN